jgi:hypothetical protein
MSEICFERVDWAFVLMNFLTPIFAASSVIDCVSAIRNGLSSFSDWEKPTIAFFRSIVAPLYWASEQVGGAVAGGRTRIGAPGEGETDRRDERDRAGEGPDLLCGVHAVQLPCCSDAAARQAPNAQKRARGFRKETAFKDCF